MNQRRNLYIRAQQGSGIQCATVLNPSKAAKDPGLLALMRETSRACDMPVTHSAKTGELIAQATSEEIEQLIRLYSRNIEKKISKWFLG